MRFHAEGNTSWEKKKEKTGLGQLISLFFCQPRQDAVCQENSDKKTFDRSELHGCCWILWKTFENVRNLHAMRSRPRCEWPWCFEFRVQTQCVNLWAVLGIVLQMKPRMFYVWMRGTANWTSIFWSGKIQGNRLTRRPATVVNIFQPCWSWNAQNPVFFFSHFSSLGGIFKDSFCTAWANSKFRKCVFVEAKLSFFSRWKKNGIWLWGNNFYVQSKSCGSAAYFLTLPQALRLSVSISIYIYIQIYLSDYLSKYLKIMYPCCARYVQSIQKRHKRRACGIIATYVVSVTQTIC